MVDDSLSIPVTSCRSFQRRAGSSVQRREYVVGSVWSKCMLFWSSLLSLVLKVKARSPLQFITIVLLASRSCGRRVNGLNLGCILDLSWFFAPRTCARIACSSCPPFNVWSIAIVVESSSSNSYGRTSAGVGGIGSVVSSSRIWGCSQIDFH